jgi:hypothetical protein
MPLLKRGIGDAMRPATLEDPDGGLLSKSAPDADKENMHPGRAAVLRLRKGYAARDRAARRRSKSLQARNAAIRQSKTVDKGNQDKLDTYTETKATGG